MKFISQLSFLLDLVAPWKAPAPEDEKPVASPALPLKAKVEPAAAFSVPGHPEVRVLFEARMKKGWRLECHKWEGRGVLHLPRWMGESGAAAIRTMALEWAALSFGRQSPQKKMRRKEIEKHVWKASSEYFISQGRSDPMERVREVLAKPQGNTHNLSDVFARVNQEYFDGKLQCRITWSSRAGGLSFHSERKDRKGQSYHLISISRGYDFPNCPAWAVEGVVYHECLHAFLGVAEVNGRRQVHSSEFRALEKKYRFYHQWIEWHRTVLPRNVRKLRT